MLCKQIAKLACNTIISKVYVATHANHMKAVAFRADSRWQLVKFAVIFFFCSNYLITSI